ncbi:protein ENHANCED DISEASE RESISTANCE 4 [Forsythia ovata]|uniref:Protein ENHANCED DISEASE RESISTANCE 4 n=1 Tax=Forsythia ovata TaxID=205694 RepID=A0ABD1X8Y9_9LAMI
MSTQPTTKVRLVRCPRCRQVLAELPDVPLYTCGGCGTILKAKNQKNESNDSNVRLQETDAVVKTEHDRVSEEQEETGSNQDLTPPLSGESSPEKDNTGDHGEHDKSFSDEISSPPEVNYLENEDSSADVKKSLKRDEGKCPLEQNSDRFDSSFLKDYNREWSGGRNLSDESPSSSECNCHMVEVSTQAVRQCTEWDDMIPLDGCRGRDPMEVGENTKGIISRYLVPENDVKSQNISKSLETASHSAGRTTEVNEDIKIHPLFRSLSKEDDLNTLTGDLFVSAQSPLNESMVSVDIITSDSEHMEHSRSPQIFGRTSSVDTLGSSPLVDPITDLSVKREDLLKSPTIGSYYAYDGSVSSYDGNDDQIPNHILQPSSRKFDLPETKRYDHASGNRTRVDEEGISRSPFSSSDFMESHRNGNGKVKHSSYQHNLFEHHPSFHSPDEPSYSEPDKLDLLRMVYELEDQLNRMRFSNDMTSGRFPDSVDEKYTPLYNDHLVPEREMHADLNRPRYHMRHGQVQGWPGQSGALRMPYPGEAADHSRQVNCSCVHCFLQDLHCSPQFPSHSMCCDNVHSHASSSSTPQHYTSSEVSLLDDGMKKSYSKEKYQAAKRHIRPIAGGAPLIACYHCSELLQLPADFLIFEKKYHRLRCNACLEVLKFSLLKGSNIVQYVPDVFAPPPSEAENYNDANSKRNLVPISLSNPHPNANHVPYSDDYELSCRSSSTKREASPVRSSFGRHQMKASSNKIASVDESMGDRQMKSILRESQNKNERVAKSYESTGTSSKMSKWKKASAELEGSPLHRLMGYSSISQVLK